MNPSLPWQVGRARSLAEALRRNWLSVNGRPAGISNEAAASEVDLLAAELERALKSDGRVIAKEGERG